MKIARKSLSVLLSTAFLLNTLFGTAYAGGGAEIREQSGALHPTVLPATGLIPNGAAGPEALTLGTHPLLDMLGANPDFQLQVGEQMNEMLGKLNGVGVKNPMPPHNFLGTAVNSLARSPIANWLFTTDASQTAEEAFKTFNANNAKKDKDEKRTPTQEIARLVAQRLLIELEHGGLTADQIQGQLGVNKFPALERLNAVSAGVKQIIESKPGPGGKDYRKTKDNIVLVRTRDTVGGAMPAALANQVLAKYFDAKGLEQKLLEEPVVAASPVEMKKEEAAPVLVDDPRLPVAVRLGLKQKAGKDIPEVNQQLKAVLALGAFLGNTVELDENSKNPRNNMDGKMVNLSSDQFKELVDTYGIDTLTRTVADIPGVHSLYVDQPTEEQWQKYLKPNGAYLTNKWILWLNPSRTPEEHREWMIKTRDKEAWDHFINSVSPLEVLPQEGPERTTYSWGYWLTPELVNSDLKKAVKKLNNNANVIVLSDSDFHAFAGKYGLLTLLATLADMKVQSLYVGQPGIEKPTVEQAGLFWEAQANAVKGDDRIWVPVGPKLTISKRRAQERREAIQELRPQIETLTLKTQETKRKIAKTELAMAKITPRAEAADAHILEKLKTKLNKLNHKLVKDKETKRKIARTELAIVKMTPRAGTTDAHILEKLETELNELNRALIKDNKALATAKANLAKEEHNTPREQERTLAEYKRNSPLKVVTRSLDEETWEQLHPLWWRHSATSPGGMAKFQRQTGPGKMEEFWQEDMATRLRHSSPWFRLRYQAQRQLYLAIQSFLDRLPKSAPTLSRAATVRDQARLEIEQGESYYEAALAIVTGELKTVKDGLFEEWQDKWNEKYRELKEQDDDLNRLDALEVALKNYLNPKIENRETFLKQIDRLSAPKLTHIQRFLLQKPVTPFDPEAGLSTLKDWTAITLEYQGKLIGGLTIQRVKGDFGIADLPKMLWRAFKQARAEHYGIKATAGALWETVRRMKAQHYGIGAMAGVPWKYMGRAEESDGTPIPPSERIDLSPWDRLFWQTLIDLQPNAFLGTINRAILFANETFGWNIQLFGDYLAGAGIDGQNGRVTLVSLLDNKIMVKRQNAVPYSNVEAVIPIRMSPMSLRGDRGNAKEASGALFYALDENGWFVQNYFRLRKRVKGKGKVLTNRLLPRDKRKLIGPGYDHVNGPGKIYSQWFHYKTKGVKLEPHAPTGVEVVPIAVPNVELSPLNPEKSASADEEAAGLPVLKTNGSGGNGQGGNGYAQPHIYPPKNGHAPTNSEDSLQLNGGTPRSNGSGANGHAPTNGHAPE